MARPKNKSVGVSRGRKKAAAGKASGTMIGLADAEVTPSMDVEPEVFPQEMSEVAPLSNAQDLAVLPMMLPDCLDSAAAGTIKEMLLAQRGNALTVDASQVRRVGVQSLQVLVAAAADWQRNGLNYRLENPSREFLETIALIGLPHQDLLLEGHQ